MGIKMNMFAGNQMTAANDGMIYDKMIAESGILNGCEMTFMGANQIHIAKGYLIIKGRLCTILEETINVEMANTDVELPGRLYIHADLADTITPVKFVSVVSDPLPDLIQDEDFNFDNGIYELELGTYTAGRVAITDFTPTCGMIEDMGGVAKKVDDIETKVTELTGNLTALKAKLGFIDTDTLITTIKQSNFSWEATANCWLIGLIQANGQSAAKVLINGVQVAQEFVAAVSSNSMICIPVMQGQLVTTHTHGTYDLNVYKMQ